jgi:hypothetical protein
MMLEEIYNKEDDQRSICHKNYRTMDSAAFGCIVPHTGKRIQIDWQWPLSGVHSITW